MSNADIAEYLSIAYALHCSNCLSNNLEPQPYSVFMECYLKVIPEFRRNVGADNQYTG